MRLTKIVVCFVVVCCAFAPIVCAQSKDTPKVLTHAVFAPYWTAEPGWDSMFLLRNNMTTTPLIVTPLVRLASGREVRLTPVTIPGDDVVNIDIGDQLQRASPPIPIQAGTFGSVVFKFDSPSHRNLYAAVMVHAVGEPIGYHIDAFGSDEQDYIWAREGIWWLPRPSVKDNLVIANASEKPNRGQLTIYDAAGKSSRQTIELSPRQTVRLSMSDLVKSAGLMGTYGGFTFQIAERSGSVDTVHFVYDETSGFSALMKMFDHDPAVPLSERLFAGQTTWTTWAPMLALQNPDPALALPKDAQLQPQVLIRNTTVKPQIANVKLTWRSDSDKGVNPLAPIQLKPSETRLIDVGALQQKGRIPLDAHWALVEISSPTAKPDDIMAIASSYDSTGRYGAQTPFSDQLADHWVGGEFQVDATHNSLIAITNAGKKPANAQITFHYNHGQNHYEILKTIAPGDQFWLNMGDIIRGAVPDRNGATFPADLTSGSYDIHQVKGVGNPSLFEGKIIADKTNGHLAYGCVSCCGYCSVIFDPDPLDGGVGLGYSDSILAQNCCSAPPPDDVTYAAYNWASDNPPVASVANANTNLLSPGTANGSSTVDLLWGNRLKTCPTVPKTRAGGIHSRTVSQTPATLNMSSGDTNMSISVTVYGPAGILAFATGLTSNLHSNSLASFAIAGSNNAGGTASYGITVSGTNSPSGIFSAIACVSGACSPQGTIVTIPPQDFIQVLWGEANGQPRKMGDYVTEPAIGSTIRNRLGNPAFPGGQTGNYQPVIEATGQYQGFNVTSQQITTGIKPELDVAAAIFNGSQQDTSGGSTCIFSPDATGWKTIHDNFVKNPTDSSHYTVSQDPNCWSSLKQFVIKASVGLNANGSGAPAFLFERSKAKQSDPTVVQIP